MQKISSREQKVKDAQIQQELEQKLAEQQQKEMQQYQGVKQRYDADMMVITVIGNRISVLGNAIEILRKDKNEIVSNHEVKEAINRYNKEAIKLANELIGYEPKVKINLPELPFEA